MPKYTRRQPARARRTFPARVRSPTTTSAPAARKASARSSSRRTSARTSRPRPRSAPTTAPPTPPTRPAAPVTRIGPPGDMEAPPYAGGLLNGLHLCEAAVHEQFRARDVAAVVGSEEDHGLGD